MNDIIQQAKPVEVMDCLTCSHLEAHKQLQAELATINVMQLSINRLGHRIAELEEKLRQAQADKAQYAKWLQDVQPTRPERLPYKET